jgi:hypothetical protein
MARRRFLRRRRRPSPVLHPERAKETLADAGPIVESGRWHPARRLALSALAIVALGACRGSSRHPVVSSLVVIAGASQARLQETGVQLAEIRGEAVEALREAGFTVREAQDAQSAEGYRATVSVVDARQVRRAPLDGPAEAEELRAEVVVEIRLGGSRDAETALRESTGWSEPVRIDESAAAPLLRAIRNASRRAAADLLLGITESAKTDRELVADLDSADSRLRDRAIQVLADRKNPMAVPALIGRLRDPDPVLVERAVGALAQIRDPRAVEPLIDLSHRREGPSVAQLAWIIGDIGGPDAEAYLLTLASGHPEALVRRAAEQALAQSRARRAAEHRSDGK